MHVSPIKCYSVQMNSTRNNTPQQVSFCGGKTAVTGKAKKAVGSSGSLLLAPLLAPFALLSGILQNKNDEIERLTSCMLSEYKNHLGHLENFQKDINKMNKIIDKHTINDDYAQFAKEAMEFLQTNFRNSHDACDQSARLEVFGKNEPSGAKLGKFMKFMDTVKKSAIVAVSSKNKDIDINELNKNIEEARNYLRAFWDTVH